ncbi:MAG: type II secretion system protein M [Desulfatibacillum sp.]|nr:type II secretion system protein M [Desulfatibacillum sp.]
MNRLGNREKLILAAGIVIVLTVLIHALVISPVINGNRTRQATIRNLENDLVTMADVAGQYEKAKMSTNGDWDKLINRKDFSLENYLGQLARQSQVMGKTKYIKSTKKPIANSTFAQSIADIKLDDVTMEELLNYLHKIETSPNFLSVKRITITRSQNPDDYGVSSIFQVTTIEAEKEK